MHQGDRYVICLNPKQARKDAYDREAIIAALREQIKKGPKSLVGNKGYRKYVTIERAAPALTKTK